MSANSGPRAYSCAPNLLPRSSSHRIAARSRSNPRSLAEPAVISQPLKPTPPPYVPSYLPSVSATHGDSKTISISSIEVVEYSPRPMSIRSTSTSSIQDDDDFEVTTRALAGLTTHTTMDDILSSIRPADTLSMLTRDSSANSSASSLYSNDEHGFEELDQYSSRTMLELGIPTITRSNTPDQTLQEGSSLARKTSMYKNSRLSLQLPSFHASLSTWSMVCRAAQTSHDCYGPPARARRGTYHLADPSRDIKAMIVDEQIIDGCPFIVVAIRGTDHQSLSDWGVNMSAEPVKPTGFLDDEQNSCHAGFLQVAKAMIKPIANCLRPHAVLAQRPSLLFTGHSAGGAVAAMLYSHMLSTPARSELAMLAGRFSSINCITFGAPPISVKPLRRRGQGFGVFLAFANEGDPIVRLSNSAYLRSLAKIMTATELSSTAREMMSRTVRAVRGSRNSVIYQKRTSSPPPTPWEELPHWSTPAASLTNAGEMVLLRAKDHGSARASRIMTQQLKNIIFGDFSLHSLDVYRRRIKELALEAMTDIDVRQ